MTPAAGHGESQGGRGIVRGALLVGWCFVLWGSVLLLATAWALVTRGGGAALALFTRLSPVNQALAASAAVVWALVAWALRAARTQRTSESA